MIKKILLLFTIVQGSLLAQINVPGNNFGYTRGSFQATDAGAATYQMPVANIWNN